MKSVSDGKMTDMEEAVALPSHPLVASPPPIVQHLGDVVQHAQSVVDQVGKFSDTINDICGKLEFLQNLGDKLSEVGYSAVLFTVIEAI
jgi:hypothetical protein